MGRRRVVKGGGPEPEMDGTESIAEWSAPAWRYQCGGKAVGGKWGIWREVRASLCDAVESAGCVAGAGFPALKGRARTRSSLCDLKDRGVMLAVALCVCSWPAFRRFGRRSATRAEESRCGVGAWTRP